MQFSEVSHNGGAFQFRFHLSHSIVHGTGSSMEISVTILHEPHFQLQLVRCTSDVWLSGNRCDSLVRADVVPMRATHHSSKSQSKNFKLLFHELYVAF